MINNKMSDLLEMVQEEIMDGVAGVPVWAIQTFLRVTNRLGLV